MAYDPEYGGYGGYDPVTDSYLSPRDQLAQLYRDVLGREPDEEGFNWWLSQIGSTLDPSEINSWMAGAQQEIANRPKDDGYFGDPDTSVTPPPTPEPPKFTPTPLKASGSVSLRSPGNYTQEAYNNIRKQIDAQAKLIESTGYEYGRNSSLRVGGAGGNYSKLVDKQAEMLASLGLKDIRDFKQIPVARVYAADGDLWVMTESGYYEEGLSPDSSGPFVDPTYRRLTDAERANVRPDGYVVIDPETAGLEDFEYRYRNSLTGEEFNTRALGDRSGGAAWAETGSGRGYTYFKVQMAPDGTPIFIPETELTGWDEFKEGMLPNLIAMAKMIPVARPFAVYAEAALALDNGVPIGKVIANVVANDLLDRFSAEIGQFSGSVGSTIAPSASAATQAAIGNAVVQAGAQGILAALTGQDVSKAMVGGLVQGAMAPLTNEVAKTVLGKDNFSAVSDLLGLSESQVAKIVTRGIQNSVSAALTGGDPLRALTDTLVTYGVSEAVASSVASHLDSQVRAGTAGADSYALAVGATRNLTSTAVSAALTGEDPLAVLTNNPMATISNVIAGYQSEVQNAEAIREGWKNAAQRSEARAYYNDPKLSFAQYVDLQTSDLDELKSIYKSIAGRDATDDELSMLEEFLGYDEKLAKSSLTKAISDAQNADKIRAEELNKILKDPFASEVDLLEIMQSYGISKSFIERTTGKTYDDIYAQMDARVMTEPEVREMFEIKNGRQPTPDEILNYIGRSAYVVEPEMQILADISATTYVAKGSASNPEDVQRAAAEAARQGYNSFRMEDQDVTSFFSARPIEEEASAKDAIMNAKSYNEALGMAQKLLGPGYSFSWKDPATGKIGNYRTSVPNDPNSPFDGSKASTKEQAARLAASAGKNVFTFNGMVYEFPKEMINLFKSSATDAEVKGGTKEASASTLSTLQRTLGIETTGNQTLDKIFNYTVHTLGTTFSAAANQASGFGNAYQALTGDSAENGATKFGNWLKSVADSLSSEEIADQKRRFLRETEEIKRTSRNKAEIDSRTAAALLKYPAIVGTEVAEELNEEVLSLAQAMIVALPALYAGGPGAYAAALPILTSLHEASYEAGLFSKDVYDQLKARGASEEMASEARSLALASKFISSIPVEYLEDASYAKIVQMFTKGVIGGGAAITGAVGANTVANYVDGYIESILNQQIVRSTLTGQNLELADAFLNRDAAVNATIEAIIAKASSSSVAIGASVIGKDVRGENITLNEFLNGTKILNPSTLDMNAKILKTTTGYDITLGGALSLGDFVGMPTMTLQSIVPDLKISNDSVAVYNSNGVPVTIGQFTSLSPTELDLNTRIQNVFDIAKITPTTQVTTAPTNVVTTQPTTTVTTAPTATTQATTTVTTQPTATTQATTTVTTAPTTTVTTAPTTAPTTVVTTEPTTAPTTAPTTVVTTSPTVEPTTAVTTSPTATTSPTTDVTTSPTTSPTTEVTTQPTTSVTTSPTTDVTTQPTTEVTTQPTTSVTTEPTTAVTTSPTTAVTTSPTTDVTTSPTTAPTTDITTSPTASPTTEVTTSPTVNVTTRVDEPTPTPTPIPTPTPTPTQTPTSVPTSVPTSIPTAEPTVTPTPTPTVSPTVTTRLTTTGGLPPAFMPPQPATRSPYKADLPNLIETKEKGGFESPLAAFLKLAGLASAVTEPSPTPSTDEASQGSMMNKYQVQQNLDYLNPDKSPLNPDNYFSYGQQNEIERILSGKKAGGAVTLMADGGYAQGGTRHGNNAHGALSIVHSAGKPRVDYRQGDAVTGVGDGQSDDIPAMLADGEFVIPADVVAALGNGSTKAGSDALYEMMHEIRRVHRDAKPKDLPPPAKSPLSYIGRKSRR